MQIAKTNLMITKWFLTLMAFCLFVGNDMYSSLFLHFPQILCSCKTLWRKE